MSILHRTIERAMRARAPALHRALRESGKLQEHVQTLADEINSDVVTAVMRQRGGRRVGIRHAALVDEDARQRQRVVDVRVGLDVLAPLVAVAVGCERCRAHDQCDVGVGTHHATLPGMAMTLAPWRSLSR